MVAPLTNIAPKCQREIIESKKNRQRETERETSLIYHIKRGGDNVGGKEEEKDLCLNGFKVERKKNMNFGVLHVIIINGRVWGG